MPVVVTKHSICPWESEVASSLDSGGLRDCGEGDTGRKSPLDSWGSRFRERCWLSGSRVTAPPSPLPPQGVEYLGYGLIFSS